MTAPDPMESGVWLHAAGLEAQKATCRRRNVGAVLVVNHQPVGWGHNWTPVGTSCQEGDCPRGLKSPEEAKPGVPPYDDCLSLHAEFTALMSSVLWFGVGPQELRRYVSGGTMYVTAKPCDDCRLLLHKFDIRVVYIDEPLPFGDTPEA